VFKVERGPAGEKIAYLRMFSGTVRTRDRLQFRDADRKITAISVFDLGASAPRAAVTAGHIGKVWGLGDVQIGDAIGNAETSLASHHFAPPTLETVIVPRHRGDKGALHVALAQLAEQDPLINLRQDDARQELFVSLYGEVQREVIRDTLAADYDLDVEFRETTMICIERPVGTAAALEELGKAPNPFLATVGLRIEPAAIDSGIEFRLDVEVGSIPLYVYKSVGEFRDSLDDVVQTTLQHGLVGWRVTDCAVTLTHSGYDAPGTTAADFRKLTPIVLMRALQRAGTVVCEPIHHFRLEIPADTLGPMFSVLARVQAVPEPPVIHGASCTLEGEIPAARVHELRQLLPGPTRGHGILESELGSYRPVAGRG
jgi:ribosomal protection tetracycline resistance protein